MQTILQEINDRLSEINKGFEPAYHSVLISEIRYASNLSPLQKLIYSEYTSLMYTPGYTLCTNTYLSEVFFQDIEIINTAVSDMVKKGFLVNDKKEVGKLWLYEGFDSIS